jgi:transposase
LQGKELRVGKKRVGRHPQAFREQAVERLKTSSNVRALAKELQIERSLLYKWRREMEPLEAIGMPPADQTEGDLRKQVARLKQLLAEKTLEVDFFRGALQKVEARRQSNIKAGGTASTPESGN